MMERIAYTFLSVELNFQQEKKYRYIIKNKMILKFLILPTFFNRN